MAMDCLRISQTRTDDQRHRVQLRLEAKGQAPLEAVSTFAFALTDQDREDLRWYLEDYLVYPMDPAPTIAARIEQRMADLGEQLFREVFQSSEDARDLWADLRPRLAKTRVEIATSVQEATSIPWELLRDSKSDVPLALRAQAFVRTQPQTVQPVPAVRPGKGPIRILLVICRPREEQDVPFRSVASRLIRGLSEDSRALFQLDVLRPPTFERLGEVLRAARAAGEPYHVVHFDGHGWYGELEPEGGLAALVSSLNSVVLDAGGSGAHGYLAFEHPGAEANLLLVRGQEVGKLLVETEVPVLVLNACRSAHADVATAPEAAGDSPHDQVRAFGSLAQEVLDQGMPAALAWRYNVYVVTAAQFVADFYAALTQGRTVGEAATLGRKKLHDQPLREIAFEPRPLQDWCVPVVYEAAPVRLFPEPKKTTELTISLDAGEGPPQRGQVDSLLPRPPDVGFIGRDETLLALDRAFDTQSVVLLHAYAGSGKTTTAAEFARWYSLTGGVEGPVLFTSFEQYRPVPRVLDEIERVFGSWLERGGVNWLALEDDARRDVALQALGLIPVLWIWDNVEPVAGFPAGTPSAWTAAEQRELADFLRDARGTKAKFLLTSRRDEKGWLGDLPARVTVPPMPLQERVEMARALAAKRGHRLTEVADWRPLLEFTQGNPLTITVLVGQALRDGLGTREQIEAFVEQLRRGEAEIKDDEAEGRSGSLAASLSYGLDHAFTEPERRILALLHLFQSIVAVDTLRHMGDQEEDWSLPEPRGATPGQLVALLDRAAEIGLLAPQGSSHYAIHPALPWYFRDLFEKCYPGRRTEAERAFTEAMGWLGNYLHQAYERGDRDQVASIAAEEANLLHSCRLARARGWWRLAVSAMQGLDQLYDHTGRPAEWARLVEGIVPDFVDPTTDGPLPGREDEWSLVTEYRVRLARKARDLAEAERLQRICVEWDRRRAAEALEAPAGVLDDAQRNAVRTLTASLHDLGQVQHELRRPQCLDSYQEALDLGERIGDRAMAAVCASSLGNAYALIPSLRDLAEAERWYQRALDLREAHDRLGRARSHGQLGGVAYGRFAEAREAGRPESELLGACPANGSGDAQSCASARPERY